jgi:hypothetical protein
VLEVTFGETALDEFRVSRIIHQSENAYHAWSDAIPLLGTTHRFHDLRSAMPGNPMSFSPGGRILAAWPAGDL